MSWKIVNQTQTTRPDPQRGFVEGVVVAFQTGAGHTGSVFIPNAQFTLDNVRQAVTAQADLLDSVGQLSG